MANKETRQARVSCLLTRREWEAICAAAERVGLPVSAYMRQAALYRAAMEGARDK